MMLIIILHLRGEKWRGKKNDGWVIENGATVGEIFWCDPYFKYDICPMVNW